MMAYLLMRQQATDNSSSRNRCMAKGNHIAWKSQDSGHAVLIVRYLCSGGLFSTPYPRIFASFAYTTLSGTTIMVSLESVFAACAVSIAWLPDDAVISFRLSV
jgi:hypothetical protein